MKSQLVNLNDENGKMNANLRMVCVLLFLVCTVLPAAAQKFTGSISGVVSDRSGAVVPGASVTVTNKGTGDTRTAATNRQGEYEFPDLPAGAYAVQSHQTSFTTFLSTGADCP